MKMLLSYLVTALMGPFVSLLMSLLLWVLFMICFTEEKVLKELNLVQSCHGHNG
uniref:Pti1b n=1 Tax=Arundo donax TaxID=35708 RepID=A0A0A9DWU2_ARUDO